MEKIYVAKNTITGLYYNGTSFDSRRRFAKVLSKDEVETMEKLKIWENMKVVRVRSTAKEDKKKKEIMAGPVEQKVVEKSVKSYATVDRLKIAIRSIGSNHRYIIHRLESGRFTPIFIWNRETQPLEIVSRGYMIVG